MRKPKKITTVFQLERLALARRSVVVPKSYCFHGPIPAAFCQNQIGVVLCRLFRLGMYVYEPRAKPRFGREVKHD